jgi:hypothetical protein
MNHNEIRHMLSDYLDGSVTAQAKTEIEDHLKTCQECEKAVNELRKTIEQVKSIEEIDPPAWMTQKIMAKVRAEAEEKRGFFQRLLFPLTFKLPLQAVAVVFLTIAAFYIYWDIQPTEKFSEAPLPSKQEFASKKETPPAPAAERESSKADDSSLRSKQVPQTPGYKALDMRQEYEAPAPPVLKGKLEESAPAKPAELPAPAKKDMVMEKRAAAPQASTLGMAQEETAASAGAASQAKAERKSVASMKKAKESVDKAEAGHRLERDIIEKYANGNSKVVVSYEVIDSRKVMLAEERFNSDGERHGIQKEYYASGQLKTEAQYGYGKLEWYMEYGPDGVKKIGKTDYDWFWLKK